MGNSPKQRFLKDIEESIRINSQEIEMNRGFKVESEEKISAYLEVEKTLSESPDDQILKHYIQRNVLHWKKLVSEYDGSIFDFQKVLESIASIRPNLEKRKEDLSL